MKFSLLDKIRDVFQQMHRQTAEIDFFNDFVVESGATTAQYASVRTDDDPLRSHVNVQAVGVR